MKEATEQPSAKACGCCLVWLCSQGHMVSLLNVDSVSIPYCPLPSPCCTDGPLLGSYSGVAHYAHSRVVCGAKQGTSHYFPGERGWEDVTGFVPTAGRDSRITASSPQPAGPDSKASIGQSSTVCKGFSSRQHSSPRIREVLSPAQSVLFSHKMMNSDGVTDAGFTKCHLHETQQ